MANNPFDPPIVQVKKLLDRNGMSTVNHGFGSRRMVAPTSRPAPAPELPPEGVTTLSGLDDVDTDSASDGDVLTYDILTGTWIPASGGSGGTSGYPTWILDDTLGDGTTDATAALQTLLDAAAVAGGRVVVPTGVYLITDLVTIGSNTHLDLNDGAVLKRGSSTMTGMLANKGNRTVGGYGQASNIRISGGTLDGNKAAYSTDCALIGFSHVSGLAIEDVLLTRLGGTWHLIELNATENARISGCRFEDSLTDTRLTEYVQLDLAKGTAYFPWFGPYDNTPCRNIVFTGCSFTNTITTTQVAAIGSHSSTTGFPHTGITVADCTIRNLAVGVRPNNWSQYGITGCRMSQVLSGIDDRVDGSAEVYSDLTGVSIVGNTIVGNGSTSVGQGRGISISGTLASGVSGKKLTGVTIIGNTIRAMSQYGIGCDLAEGVTIANNTLTNIGTLSGTVSRVAIWMYRGVKWAIIGNRITGTNPGAGAGANLADIQVGDTSSTAAADALLIGNVCDGSIDVKQASRVRIDGNTAAAITQTGSTLVQMGGNFVAGSWVEASAGASSLDALTDVDTTGAVSGDLLGFNGTSWLPVDPPTGVTVLDDLTDVTTAGAVTGDLLGFNGTSWVPVDAPTGGGATVLDDLTDVDTTGLADGDTLIWDDTVGQWKPQTPAAGGGPLDLDDLTDVDTSTTAPTVGDVLTYDGTSWVPGAPAGGSGSVVTATGANGTYEKYPDGLLICKHRWTSNSTSGAQTFAWTFPEPFIGSTSPVITVVSRTTVPQNVFLGYTETATPLVSCTIQLNRSTNSSTLVDMTAIGRWK